MKTVYPTNRTSTPEEDSGLDAVSGTSAGADQLGNPSALGDPQLRSRFRSSGAQGIGRGTIALIKRNSTPSQIGNNRSRAQVDDMEPRIRELGFNVEIVDEQGTSGADLAKRPKAQYAIEGVKSGRFVGVAYLDLARATRDPDGIDARLFKRVCREYGALFITRQHVYDFQNEDDVKMFDLEALFAAWEYKATRTRLWVDGIFVRARREPFFRGRVPIGYHAVWEDEKLRVGPRPPAKWEKDPAQAALMDHVTEAFDRASSLTEAVTWLNSRCHLPPRKRPWSARVLGFLLNNPLYYGVYQFGRTNERSSTIWNEDPRIPVFHLPHLAYWDQLRVEAWRVKFQRHTPAVRRRRRKFIHPLLGLLVCIACEKPMMGHGPLGYRCRLWPRDGLGRGCKRPQTIRETSAFGALKALIPVVLLPNLAELAARAIHNRWEEQTQVSPNEAALVTLREQEKIIEENIDCYRERGLRIEAKDLDRLSYVRSRIKELESDIGQALSLQPMSDEFVYVAERLLARPEKALSTFERLTSDLQGEVLRVLLAEVAVKKVRGGGGSSEFQVSWYRPRMPFIQADHVLAKVKIREESEQALRAVRPRLDELFGEAAAQ